MTKPDIVRVFFNFKIHCFLKRNYCLYIQGLVKVGLQLYVKVYALLFIITLFICITTVNLLFSIPVYMCKYMMCIYTYVCLYVYICLCIHMIMSKQTE